MFWVYRGDFSPKASLITRWLVDATPDLPALNAERGMMLLVIWLLLATGGIVIFDYATSTTMRARAPIWLGPTVPSDG